MADDIHNRFSESVPLLLAADEDALKLELKPYIQPFEEELAKRELRGLLDPQDQVTEKYGYYVVRTQKPEEIFRQRLTYWQRVGRTVLRPTVQGALEFTQNGWSHAQAKKELHNTRRLRYGPHDLHEYRGKFFPQLVGSLMNISGVPEDALVLDPMCGSGTAPCEVVASGRSAIAADLNPLSVLIASVKAAIVLEKPKVFCETITKHLKAFRFGQVDPADIWSEDDLTYLRRWFAPAALSDLASALDDINEISRPLYRNFFRVCLSNVVRSVSWQKDTDLRVRKEPRAYDPGDAIERFRKEALEQLDRIHAYLCVLPHCESRPHLDIRQGNAVTISNIFPEYIGKVQLLVTSPPYATALPYIDTDRLSLIILGLLPRKKHADTESLMIGTREVTERQRRETWDYYIHRKAEVPASVSRLITHIAKHNHGDTVGFRRRNLPALLGKYFLDMLDAMRSAHHLMQPGAHGYYVVGNNSTILDGDKLEIPTDKLLFEMAAVAGWHPEEALSMELLHSRDIFRENRGSAETILCLKS